MSDLSINIIFDLKVSPLPKYHTTEIQLVVAGSIVSSYVIPYYQRDIFQDMFGILTERDRYLAKGE